MIGEGVLTAANGDRRYMSYVAAPTAAPVLGQWLPPFGSGAGLLSERPRFRTFFLPPPVEFSFVSG